MRLTSCRVASGVALVVAMSLMACGDDPASPTIPSNTPPPTTTPTVTVTRLELTGPESVAPGTTAQFTATAHRSDGSTQEVTQALWRTGNSRILTVTPTGLVSGVEPGETSLSVSFSGRSATRSAVFVLPPGTYRVAGVVRDTGVPISGAQITVTGGTALGLSTTANPNYRLYGVSGPTELRATRDGYIEQKIRLDVASHQTVDFELTLERPRVELAGAYTLEVTAAGHCTQLPEEARTRRYTAMLTQTGPSIAATLSGATFKTDRGRPLNSFQGTVDTDGAVVFRLSEAYSYYFYSYYPDVLEELTPTTSLAIGGEVSARAGRSGIVGMLNGVFQVLDPGLREIAGCRSADHQFVLSR